MRKKIIIFLILISLLSQPVLAIPGDWWGTVKINNKYIADGSIVNVYVNDNATAVTSSIVGSLLDNYYLVHVVAKKGDNITFKINNIVVEQSNQIWSEGDHTLNLSIKVNDSLSTSVSTNSNVNTIIDAIKESNVSLELKTNDNVSGSIDIIKYPQNPKLNYFGVIDINKYVQIEASPEITAALSWAIIKIHYSHNELGSIDENSLKIYYYNLTTDNWIPYNSPNGGVNTVENYVWANTTHFSFYGSGGLLADGQSCNSGSECSSGFCVHNICRSSSTYCGDNFCDAGETCSSCSADCGTCPPTGDGGGSGGGGGGGTPPKNQTTQTNQSITCTESWACTDWSSCTNEIQTRICTDSNKCSTIISKPVESQSCTTPKPEVKTPTEVPTNVTAAPTGFFLGLSMNEWIMSIIAGIAIAVIIIFAFLKKRKR